MRGPSEEERPATHDGAAGRPVGPNGKGQLGLGAPGRAYRIQVITTHSTAKARPIP